MSDASSHHALTTAAVVVVRADRGVIRATGADRASWLQGLLTNDVVALAPGQGCYSAWLTPQGRMITDAIVLAEGDAVSLDVPGAIGDDLYRRLDAAIFAEDVLLTDEGGVWASLGVHGPHAAHIVSRTLHAIGGADPATGETQLSSWSEFANAALPDAGRLFRHDPYGVPGFCLRVPRAAADGWTSRLRLAGAPVVAPADLEWARIEAGRPEFPLDMDTDTIPLEAGIEDRAISFTKGCYVGQEVVVRVVHRGGGRVARRLVGLRLAGPAVPAPRAVIRQGAREVGHVTSAALSPRLGHPVALGYVRREAVEPGTTLTVDCDGTSVPATVSALPIR
ncbi:MAG: folate-binding protein YgfZ [Vicinamibacterales bacterium]